MNISKKDCSCCGKEYTPPLLQQEADYCKRCHKISLQSEEYELIVKL